MLGGLQSQADHHQAAYSDRAFLNGAENYTMKDLAKSHPSQQDIAPFQGLAQEKGTIRRCRRNEKNTNQIVLTNMIEDGFFIMHNRKRHL